MLHVLAGMTAAGATALAGMQTIMQGGGAVNAEASVQVRKGQVPSLIGLEVATAEALVAQHAKFSLNTWRNTNYLDIIPWKLDAPAMRPQPEQYVPVPIPLDPEADWSIIFTTTGDEDHFALMMLSYGQPVKPGNGLHIFRKGALTAADYSTTGAFGTAVTINDLDPNKVYRVAGLGGVGGTDVGIVRLKAPSFDGQVLQAIVPQGALGMTWFNRDSLLVTGMEAQSIDASGGAANALNYVVIYEEYGGASSAGLGSNLNARPNVGKNTGGLAMLGNRLGLG